MSSYSPELIPDCKETQLIRFQSKVVGLAKTPRRTHSMKCVNIGLLISCLLSCLLGLVYLAFDPIVRTIILNKLVLSNTSETFFLWENPPITPHFKVYFLNLTNPDEVFNGISKPRLQEVGPYTYTQKWIKQNISWHDNGTISFKTRKVFTYQPEMSCRTCRDTEDRITTLNVPVLSAYHQMRDSSWFARYSLETMVSTVLAYQPWITRSPHELTWGYDEPLFELAKMTLPEPPPFEQFGFFVKKRSFDEHLGLYTMYTGEGNPYNLSNIALFNGKKELDFWNSTECNSVHGSDGSSFNPYIYKEDTLWFFNDQMCRAMPLTFDRSISQQGLPGLRFKPREDVFMSPQKYPKENRCFVGADREMGDGVFDLTVCQFNTPVVLSWPHFLNGDAKYRQAVDGLRPDGEKHGFWFDIQQVTGTTMSAKARIQINLSVKRNEDFKQLSKVNDTLFPILWFEEGIDHLGDDIITMLKFAAVDPDTYKQYILYCLLGLCSTIVLLIFVAVTKAIANRTSTAQVERVRDQVADILQHGHPVSGDQLAATQPMLQGYGDSSDSTRSTSASHSRNSSEGSTPPYAVINVDNTAFTEEVGDKRELEGRPLVTAVTMEPDPASAAQKTI